MVNALGILFAIALVMYIVQAIFNLYFKVYRGLMKGKVQRKVQKEPKRKEGEEAKTSPKAEAIDLELKKFLSQVPDNVTQIGNKALLGNGLVVKRPQKKQK